MALAALKNIESERFAIADAKPLIEVDLNYLIADKPVPCKIFLFDAQKFTLIFQGGEIVSLSDLAEIRENFYSLGFVHESDFEAWNEFKLHRYVRSTRLELITEVAPTLKDRKILPVESFRNSYASYVFNSIHLKTQDEIEDKKIELCNLFFRRVCSNQSIQWFFERSDLEALEKHSARTAYLTLLFSSLCLPKMSVESLETLVVAAIIHQLSEDPYEISSVATASNTLKILKDGKHPISEKVILTIRELDERFNGGGSPQGLAGDKINLFSRIIMIVNIFDHTYIRIQAASRRLKMEQTVAWLKDHELEFDPKVLTRFLQFLPRLEIKE